MKFIKLYCLIDDVKVIAIVSSKASKLIGHLLGVSLTIPDYLSCGVPLLDESTSIVINSSTKKVDTTEFTWETEVDTVFVLSLIVKNYCLRQSNIHNSTSVCEIVELLEEHRYSWDYMELGEGGKSILVGDSIVIEYNNILTDTNEILSANPTNISWWAKG